MVGIRKGRSRPLSAAGEGVQWGRSGMQSKVEE